MPIHVLHGGWAVCAGPEVDSLVPGDWPPGHSWVDPTQKHLADCPGCKEFFERHFVVQNRGLVYISPKEVDLAPLLDDPSQK